MTTNSTLPDIAKAIKLSNLGAHFLESEQYDEAAALLLDAVRQFREGRELVVGMKNHHSVSRHREIVPTIPRKSLSAGYIYAKPFYLTETNVEPRLIQLSIIFNFAIARHLRSLSGNESKREKRLRTTLKLYNWVLSLERSMKDEESLLGLLPCLGLINNCAQIHQYLQKAEKAEKMFGILLSSLMLVKERGEEVDKEELAGFYFATSHLILKRPNVAKAA